MSKEDNTTHTEGDKKLKIENKPTKVDVMDSIVGGTYSNHIDVDWEFADKEKKVVEYMIRFMTVDTEKKYGAMNTKMILKEEMVDTLINRLQRAKTAKKFNQKPVKD